MHIDTAGTYTLQYTAEDSCGNTTVEERTVEVVEPPIYGVYWDGSSNPKGVRTDKSENFSDPQPAIANGTGSSPFDNIMPWSGMQIVEDSEAGTLVSIPKFWYKWTFGEGIDHTTHLQIASQETEGFFVSPAHMDRGDGNGERDIVYVARYHCSNTDYKSTSGVVPKMGIIRPDCRTAIHALGNDIWQFDYAMYWTIAMLYLVEFATWNSQGAIGYGCSPSGAVFNMGATDAMQYHTGTDAASIDTYGSVQYRHIEGLWDNAYTWVDGIYYDDNRGLCCIANPADFSDTTGGTLIGVFNIGTTSVSGFIKSYKEPASAAVGFEYALYPNAANMSGGSNSTYVCDYGNFSSHSTENNRYVAVGGYYVNSRGWGMFHMDCYGFVSNYVDNVGSRLMKLPSA